jgi:putative intracellular protease/amidase
VLKTTFNEYIQVNFILNTAPALAFKSHGIAKGKHVTSYPSMKDKLTGDYQYMEDRVVVDGTHSTKHFSCINDLGIFAIN